jgi:hypothetical protein
MISPAQLIGALRPGGSTPEHQRPLQVSTTMPQLPDAAPKRQQGQIGVSRAFDHVHVLDPSSSALKEKTVKTRELFPLIAERSKGFGSDLPWFKTNTPTRLG